MIAVLVGGLWLLGLVLLLIWREVLMLQGKLEVADANLRACRAALAHEVEMRSEAELQLARTYRAQREVPDVQT